MLLKSSKKQFLKTGILLCLELSLLFVCPAKASEKKSWPGLFETAEKLIQVDNFQYNELLKRISRIYLDENKVKELKEISLHPLYLKSLLLHSKTEFINLASTDPCRFYSFLENDLITRPSSTVQGIPVRYREGGKTKDALIIRKLFFQYIHQKKCPGNGDIQRAFKRDRVEKILKEFKYTIPDNQVNCHELFTQWNEHSSIAPLCRVSFLMRDASKKKTQLPSFHPSEFKKKEQFKKEIKQAQFFEKILSPFKKSYLNHLCKNLGTTEVSRKNFCSEFINTSFWRKTANHKIKRKELTIKCQYLFGKEKLSAQELITCANRLTKSKNLCHFLESSDYQGLSPMPDCEQISQTLHFSRLKADYQDCPQGVDNEGIINISRILLHLRNKGHEINKEQCRSLSVSEFVDLNFKNKNKQAWDFKICYHDPIENKELCLPAIIGRSETSSYSENMIIAHILKRTEKGPKSLKCHFIEEKTYRPTLLKYQHGCFLVYDQDSCTTLSCPKKIVFRNRQINHISYRGSATFDYFPNSRSSDNRSVNSILEKDRRVGPRIIRNITDLKYYLGLSPTSLVHGRGCIEDIYPRFFNKKYMNQCTPVSFIIDGLIEKNLRFYVVIRTGADNIHAPRTIRWGNVYHAVSNYRNLQPIYHWTLHGIR